MKKYNVLKGLMFMIVIPVIIIGCDDDDDNSGSGIEFVNVETAYNEEAGTPISIAFKNGAALKEEDLLIAGTATRGEDWQLESVTAEGIQISITNDDDAEVLETIRFMIPNSKGNAIHTVRIVSDDPGVLDIDLTWAAGEAAADMDLLLWKLNADEEWEAVAQSWGATFEHIAVDWTEDDGTYGLSYNYYAGVADPLDFTVTFTPTGITLEDGSEPLVFNATYTAANIAPQSSYPVVQTFKKTGTSFTEFSSLTVPASGSRQSADIKTALQEAAAKVIRKK